MLPTGLTSFEKPLDPNNGKLNAKFCMFCGLRILQADQFLLIKIALIILNMHICQSIPAPSE